MRMFDRHHKTMLPQGDLDAFSRQAVFVDIDNAAHYFLSELKQEIWDKREDFPSIVPPFPLMWMEFRQPSGIRSESKWIDVGGLRHALHGLIAVTTEVDECDAKAVLENDVLFHSLSIEISKQRDGFYTTQNRQERKKRIAPAIDRCAKARWLTVWRWNLSRGRRIWFGGVMANYLDSDGKPIPEMEFCIAPIEDGEFGSVFLPFMYAISLLHCKNTSMVDAPESKKSRLRRQKPDYPNIVYKQLVVNPMNVRQRARTDGEGQDRNRESTTRLHICRGHFKDYRFGKGLFGKYKDIYWWDHQVRGNADFGVLCKTYRVDADSGALH